MNEIIAIVFEKTGVRIKSDAIEECKILENGTLVGGAPSMIDAATQRALQESSSQFLLQQIINSNND